MITNERRKKIRKTADAVRELYGVKKASDLQNILEREGIRLLTANLDTLVKGRRISGILRNDGKVKEIYVNEAHAETRNTFTIGHELGHYFLHKDTLKERGQIVSFRSDLNSGPNVIEEDEADLFSAELLMPKKEMVRIAKAGLNNVEDLSRYFGVSRPAITRRIKELNAER